MYYDVNKINQVSNEIYGIYELYKNEYDSLKENAALQKFDKIIWGSAFPDPYSSDYISDIDDGTIPERKIYKRIPSKPDYKAKHMFNGRTPVFSLHYDEKGELCCEKFFISDPEKTIGAMFAVKDKRLYEVDVEYRNENGYAIEYISLRIDNVYSEILINGRKYLYENSYIIKAESMDQLKYGKEIIPYNDPRYQNIGSLLDYSRPPMNPEMTNEYEFAYGADGLAETWTRTGYSYGEKITCTWKMKKNLLKKYTEYGINVFNRNYTEDKKV